MKKFRKRALRRPTNGSEQVSNQYSRAYYENPQGSAYSQYDSHYDSEIHNASPYSVGDSYSRDQASFGQHSDPSNPYSRANQAGYAALQRKKKRGRRRKIVAVTVLVVAVLLVGGAAAAWAYMSSLENNMRDGLDDDLMSTLAVSDSASDPFYMLLIGVDKSEEREASNEYGGAYRTDSMILTRVDPQNCKVTMISIYRDTKVDLGEHGAQKINAAYAFGGPAMAVKAVSDLAGVPIHHYAEIDFNGFEDVVNALGGVEVEVPMAIEDWAAGGKLDAGLQTLNGEQALILCRSRHAYDDYGDGDMMRAANQRMVISAIMKKIMSSDVATMTNTISTLANYVTTDFSVSNILGFAQTFKNIDVENDVYTAMEPTVSLYENGVWWAVLDEKPWKEMMQRVDAGLPPTKEAEVDEATGVVLSTVGDGGSNSSSSSNSNVSSSSSLSGEKVSVRNGAGIAGVANEASSRISPLGVVVDTGNADDFNYQKTLVIYKDSSDAAKAQTLADALGVGQVKQNSGGTYSFTGDFLIIVGADWE